MSKRRIKVIFTHERPRDLHATLAAYEGVKASLSGEIAAPDAGVIIDSSEKSIDAKTQLLAKGLNFRYIHQPGQSIHHKITSFIDMPEFRDGLVDSNTYIDMCTDQDPCFYVVQPSDKHQHSYTGIDNCPTLGWISLPPGRDKRLSDSSPQVLLRSQGSFSTLVQQSSTGIATKLVESRVKLPNPNQFWGCLRIEVFLIRSYLIKELASILKASEHKIIECFLNVFHAFATQAPEIGSLRIRACDDRASLRRTRIDSSRDRASFASILIQLRNSSSDEYIQCLVCLENAIKALSITSSFILSNETTDYTNQPLYMWLSIRWLDRLIRLTVESYGRAIEYDLHFEMYLFAELAPNLQSARWPAERATVESGHPGIYQFWRNNPILITSSTEAMELSVASQNLILSDNHRMAILRSIPHEYWTMAQKY